MIENIITDLMVFIIPIAIVFARIYYVTFEWKHYVNQPFTEAFAVWNGGIGIHSALIGSVLTVIIYPHIKRVSFWKIVDILAPSLILGQALGQWGNLRNHMTIDGVMYLTGNSTFKLCHAIFNWKICHRRDVHGQLVFRRMEVSIKRVQQRFGQSKPSLLLLF